MQQRILREATHLFVTQGYHRISMREIAEAVGGPRLVCTIISKIGRPAAGDPHRVPGHYRTRAAGDSAGRRVYAQPGAQPDACHLCAAAGAARADSPGQPGDAAVEPGGARPFRPGLLHQIYRPGGGHSAQRHRQRNCTPWTFM
ncbi:MAG: helix-turn-helix transcriptional regulator [Anaerolineae bacterium]|nr:helix-turn-helix transcriptional regulator [Anaerolineae bacterium]